MKVKVTGVNETIDIDLGICNSVGDIIRIICQTYNYETKQVTLILLGKPLRPEFTLTEAKITDTSKIIAVVNQKTTVKPINTAQSIPAIPSQIRKTPVTPSIPSVIPPPAQPVAKIVKTVPKPEKSSDESDTDYAKRQLSSPSVKPLLKECSHFPSKSQLLLSVFEKQDPKLFNIILKKPDLLVEAIVKMADEPDIPEIPLPQNTFNRPQQSIQLSPEDWSNIQMLESLGYSKEECLEAYLACDRNTEAAANYLLESM